MRRAEAEARSVYTRASAYLGPAMPAIKEALAHLALFGLSYPLPRFAARARVLSVFGYVVANGRTRTTCLGISPLSPCLLSHAPARGNATQEF